MLSSQQILERSKSESAANVTGHASRPVHDGNSTKSDTISKHPTIPTAASQGRAILQLAPLASQPALHSRCCYRDRARCDAMRSVLTLAGSWELHSCHIRGCFTLDAAIALLPSCLQHMALSSVGIEQDYMAMTLNKLQRFSDLHTLQIGSDRSGLPGVLYLQGALLHLSPSDLW